MSKYSVRIKLKPGVPQTTKHKDLVSYVKVCANDKTSACTLGYLEFIKQFNEDKVIQQFFKDHNLTLNDTYAEAAIQIKE